LEFKIDKGEQYYCSPFLLKFLSMKRYFILILVTLFYIDLTGQVYLDLDVEPAQDTIEANVDNSIFTIIDVRTAGEYLPEHIEGAFNRDYYADDFREQLDSLDKSRTYLIYCQSGGRSGATLTLMEELQFERVYNILGGMGAWNSAGLPVTDVIPEFVNIYASTTSIFNLDNKSLIVSPNPFSDVINVSFEKNDLNLTAVIYSVTGVELLSAPLDESTELNLKDLNPGLYFISIKSKNKILTTQRLLKK